MRRPLKKKNTIIPDATYGSEKISKFINVLMWDGKKVAARKAVYGALDIIKESGADPLETFETALRNVGPSVEVRSRRVGGANYQVPREVRPERRNALAIRWIIAAVRAKKGTPTAKSLAEELTLAAQNEGVAVKKKEDTHKMAESNRAFAHFAW